MNRKWSIRLAGILLLLSTSMRPALAQGANESLSAGADEADASAAAQADVAAQADAGATAQADAATAEPASDTASYMRLDVDRFGTQIWAGATHQVGGLALTTDIIANGTNGELDVGVTFTFGSVSITPMVGGIVDFGVGKLTTFLPQFYTYFTQDKLYVESWILFNLSSFLIDGAQNSFYTRNFVTYKVSDNVAIGPAFELTYGLNDVPSNDAGLLEIPAGLIASFGYGKNNTLLLFLGYDAKKTDGDIGPLSGRFTFVHNW